MWLDYSKYGTVTNADLNNTVTIVQQVLTELPEKACCFVIAPLMASDRRSGFREEYRPGIKSS